MKEFGWSRLGGKVACVVFLGFGAAGCDRLTDQFRVDTAMYFGRQYEDQKAKAATGTNAEKPEKFDIHDRTPDPIDLDRYRFVAGSTGPTAYQEAINDEFMRNRLQSILMRTSDEICDKHKAAIMANASAFNATTSALTTGLSAVAAILTGTTGKNILSAAAATTSGTQAAVNAEVYQQLFANAIVDSIQKARTQKREIIDRKRYVTVTKTTISPPRPTQTGAAQATAQAQEAARQAQAAAEQAQTAARQAQTAAQQAQTSTQGTTTPQQEKRETVSATTIIVTTADGTKTTETRIGVTPIADYPVDEAVRDAQDYHQSCSFYQGIVTLARATERAVPDMDTLLARAEKLRTELGKVDTIVGLNDEDKRRQRESLSSQLNVIYGLIGASSSRLTTQ